MEETQLLYHGSPTSGLTLLEPSVTKYFGKPRQVCLTACLPMALLYGVKHFEYPYGYTRAGQIFYEEYFPGALEAVYGWKSASLYRCLRREDMEPTAIPNEYVTPHPVPVAEERSIPDLYGALLEQEELGELKIVRWAEVPPARRAWIREAETQTILEKDLLRLDTPFARYMQATYPESWALAQEREREGAARP